MVPICNHTFRATGITPDFGNGGGLECAAHGSPSTTELYDRTKERLMQAPALHRGRRFRAGRIMPARLTVAFAD